MLNEEFVFAIIPDHVSAEERWDKILQKQEGKTHLDLAVHAAAAARAELGVDVTIVLSSNEAVLDASTDLGAVSNQVPSFFDTELMLKTYFMDPGVDIDPSDDPWIVVFDLYTLEHDEPRQLSSILA